MSSRVDPDPCLVESVWAEVEPSRLGPMLIRVCPDRCRVESVLADVELSRSGSMLSRVGLG